MSSLFITSPVIIYFSSKPDHVILNAASHLSLSVCDISDTFLKQMDFKEGGGGGENTAERKKLAQI